MQKIENLNAAGFPRAVRDGVVLVEFSAPWCAECVVQDEIIDRMALDEKFPASARITRLCIDNAPVIAEKFKVDAIPAVVVFNDGVESCRRVGVTPEAELLKILE